MLVTLDKFMCAVQLFTKLLQQGTFVVCTSNKMPSDLYKDGLNRQYFLPFVKLIQKQMAVVEVSLAAGQSTPSIHCNGVFICSKNASTADMSPM